MTKCKHRDGCDNKVYAKGWCSGHYSRFIRTGSAGPVSLKRHSAKKKGLCCHPSGECLNKEYSGGLCSMHYNRVLSKGDIGPAHQIKRKWAGVVCKVVNCHSPVKTMGYCGMHYLRFLTHGEAGTAEPLQEKQPEQCEVQGCSRKARTKRMCDMHYQRFLKSGTPGKAEALALHRKFAPWNEDEKRCTVCKTVKSLDDFQRQNRASDGRQSCCRACIRILNFCHKHGFDENQVREILNKQSHCQICAKEEDLVIDHCHATNRIRGILCRTCNTGLGQFFDNTERLKNAIKYIDKHKK